MPDLADAGAAGAGWAEAAAGQCAGLPDVPGANGTVSLAVTVAPRREVAFHWRYEEGRAALGAAGPVPGAALALSLGADDAEDLFSGRVEPSVAFMRGRLKASGDGALLLGFLASTVTERFEQWRRGVGSIGSPESPAGV